eukprot:TRINITY_DN18912_c0_g1_i2.p1 TRINITY_DN18912_c0_g1~~TRINITY_DN18912_c0_g1_i2.p1  ORF type:complete len:124 (+),score=7.76 TRINITY_DN18912_c0_g1_i2:231-602(+)
MTSRYELKTKLCVSIIVEKVHGYLHFFGRALSKSDMIGILLALSTIFLLALRNSRVCARYRRFSCASASRSAFRETCLSSLILRSPLKKQEATLPVPPPRSCFILAVKPVSYTHLTLPTKRIV